MSKANNFLKEEDAVSPVIGVILMVAITVILAAVIAAFVFGMGPPEQAPQAALRGSSATQNDFSVVKLEHQGGDAVIMTSANTKISISGNTTTEGPVTFGTYIDADERLEAGDVLYIYRDGGVVMLHNSTTAGTDADSPVGSSGQTINVKVIDVTSQQMIADLDVRF